VETIINAPSASSEASTVWSRVFPVVYDPFLWAGERAGVRALRQELLGRARGRTVDIGSGTGLNLPHYPDSLDELVLAEPDPAMRAQLEKRVPQSGRPVRLVDAPAERLPFPNGSVDTVVSTFVLCTVADPELALEEIVRVLRPGGQLIYLEHVLSDSARLAAWQHRLAEPWRRFARGCRCDQDTGQLIADSGLRLADIHDDTWRAMPPIVRPLIFGRARKEEL
jgi:ubiquinone/menaquinone biosynthesis C-methylase UbiE